MEVLFISSNLRILRIRHTSLGRRYYDAILHTYTDNQDLRACESLSLAGTVSECSQCISIMECDVMLMDRLLRFSGLPTKAAYPEHIQQQERQESWYIH